MRGLSKEHPNRYPKLLSRPGRLFILTTLAFGLFQFFGLFQLNWKKNEVSFRSLFQLNFTNSSCPRLFQPAQLPDDYYDVPDDNWPLWHRMTHLPHDYLVNLQKIHLAMMSDPRRVLTVVVLGGSMTGGAFCVQGNLTMKECAWPHRLKLQLEKYFGYGRVNMVNIARGGTQTEVAVGSLYSWLMGVNSMKTSVDLLLTDFAVNDAHEFQGNAGRVSSHNADGPIDLYENAVALAELLVNGIHDIFPSAMHIMVISHCDICGINHPVLDGMKEVAMKAGVGMIDSRHLNSVEGKFPWIPAPTSDPRQYTAAHPDYRSHQILADVIGHSLLSGFRPACNMRMTTSSLSSISIPEIQARFSSCTKPKSLYDANILYEVDVKKEIHGVTLGEGWSLAEDVAGKPGFISTSAVSNMTLEVEFGAIPSLTVLYLRSYAHMGNFQLTLNGFNVTLHGLWDRHMSTTQVFRSQAYSTAQQMDIDNVADNDNHYGIIGFGVQPNSKHTMSFSNLGSGNFSKVKIISVITC